MKDVFNANEQDITFVKSANGKWGCNLCHFSLSHSIDVVTVAISDNPIGLDVEKITPLPEKILDKILTVEERSTLSQLPTNQKVDFVIKTWTQKESCFKLHDIKTWSPQKLALNKNNLLSQKICVNNENYYVSICSETENTVSNDTIFNLINL
jgi:phosphopantetheine--protein transferase-like protein